MKPILDQEHRLTLAPFLKSNTLMAFDYDGTLAPIVNDPKRAEMRPETKHLLRAIAQRYPTVVITGRARSDIRHFLQGIPLLEIVGNHGSEIAGVEPISVARKVSCWHTDISERLECLAGIHVENKRYSLAIHYRRSEDRDHARKKISDILESLTEARIIQGEMVVNVLPLDVPDKGNALMRVRDRFGAPRSIYVGGEDADEPAFAVDPDESFLGIRVGYCDSSAAQFYIRDQSGIEELLQVLMERHVPK